MNGRANLALSDEERQLVANTQWILTKRVVMNKVVALLGDLSEQLQQMIAVQKHNLPSAVTASTPKISKGEHYRGLPYAILDYPRYFAGDHILAFRFMFWWGNFFSATLHISGEPGHIFRDKLASHFQHDDNGNGYLYTGEDPWEHHFDNGKHVPLNQLSPQDAHRLSDPGQWVKLVYRYPLEYWDDFPALAAALAAEWLKLMKT